MKSWFNDVESIDAIAIAYDEATRMYVGAAIILNHNVDCIDGQTNIGVFVSTGWRRRGIGTALARRVIQRTDYVVTASKWRTSAKLMYERVGL